MKKKSEAHDALSLLFQQEGVPNVMVMDGALEQVQGEFCHKCRQAAIYVKQTEPHTPWSNAAESAIHELKHGLGHEMVQSRAPRCLWDHFCLERELYIHSHTALDIFSINGQVLETIISGETTDISPFALFQWYEWVMYHDTSIPFPKEQLVLGQDLGPAIDIGPAMT